MSSTGNCPRCGRSGAMATPCPTDACVQLGVHRIPAEYVTGPSDDLHLGRMFDAWLVVQRLGAGGVGELYLAVQQPVGLRAALKQLSAAGGPLASPERFLREAAALARLSHPNIVRLLAYGMRGAAPYLVMEYVEGGRTLSAALSDLNPEARLRVLVQVTHALEAAHANGVVHRDLKPDNIMLQPVAGEPHFVRLVDFGLAKFMGTGDQTTIMAGSPHYMAPEQMSRAPIGPRTDLYALGVIACELYAGRRPFGGPTINSILLLKSDPGYDPVAAITTPLSSPTAAFLRRAMARDPDERFADAAAFRDALIALGPPTHPGLASTASLESTASPIASGASTPDRRLALGAGLVALSAAAWWWFGRPGVEVDAPPRADAPRRDARSERAAGDAARPGGALPGGAPPDAAQPDAEPPDAAQPDAAQPDAAPLDAEPAATPATRSPATRPPPPTRRRRRAEPRPAPTRRTGREAARPIDPSPPEPGAGLKMDPSWTEEEP